MVNKAAKFIFLVWLSLLLGCSSTIGINSRPASFWITAYYPTWAPGVYPPDKVNYKALTHLIHFAAAPVQDAAKNYFDPVDLEGGAQQAPLITLAHQNGVKVLMSVGGIWGTGADNMTFIASDATRVQTFVNASTEYAKAKGYDGIEIDWEPPANEPDMTRMVKLFREKLNSWTERTPRGELAIAAANGVFDRYNIAETADLVDQFNIMMYDMDFVASGWCYNCEQDVVGFNAPLHRPDATMYPALHKYSHNYDGVTTDYDMTEKLVDGPMKWIELGMPANKVAPGIPFYARIYRDVDQPGVPRINFSQFSKYSDAEVALASGGTYHWDDTTKVPWIGGTATAAFGGWFYSIEVGQKFYLTYDDPASVKEKVAWTLSKNLGGIMIYELSAGVISDGSCPLLDAVVEAMGK